MDKYFFLISHKNHTRREAKDRRPPVLYMPMMQDMKTELYVYKPNLDLLNAFDIGYQGYEI